MKHDREFWTPPRGGLALQWTDAADVLQASSSDEGDIGLLGFDLEAASGRETGSGGSWTRRHQGAAADLPD